MTEHRHYRRINFHTEAEILFKETPHRCELIDLALQGALFHTEQNLPLNAGDQGLLTITLPGSDLTMEFTGELIHQRGNFYGFIFISEDAVTMGHLRRLLELNLGNGNEVDQEFHHWLKNT
ncbi:MAG: hypothetical protein BA864_07270 [Desulfuromonadales bacterium C00003093]|nr:MAG: hypothetical protein BA864_07270 [Desulfuromonadales bacterium C00003093]